MTSKLTPYINDRNVHNVRTQIRQKNGSQPFCATINDAAGVLTDYDTFPYPRWFRGVYDSEKPIVAEREAGWRPRHDNCYRLVEPPTQDIPQQYPNHCFSSACSVVFPCYPEYLEKQSDKKFLDTILNKACIVEYR